MRLRKTSGCLALLAARLTVKALEGLQSSAVGAVQDAGSGNYHSWPSLGDVRSLWRRGWRLGLRASDRSSSVLQR